MIDPILFVMAMVGMLCLICMFVCVDLLFSGRF